MTDIDHILSDEPAIEPSRGFALDVMRAVAVAQTAPSALPIPWLRLAAGAVGCGILGGLGTLVAGAPDMATWFPIRELSTAATPLGYAVVIPCVVYGSLGLHRALVRAR
jgi:hypothetical protein